MKMTLAEVRMRQQSLAEIAGKKMPEKLGYAVTKNLIKFQEEIEIIEKRRVQLAESYAKKDEAGNPVVKENAYEMEDMTSFENDFKELLAEEVEIDIRTVPASVLEKLDEERYDALSPAEMMVLDFMIEE